MTKAQMLIHIGDGVVVDLFAEPDHKRGKLLREPIYKLKIVWGGETKDHIWEQIFYAYDEVFSVFSGLYWAVEMFMEKRESLKLKKIQHLSSVHINPATWLNKPLHFGNATKNSVRTPIFSWDRGGKPLGESIRLFTEKAGLRHNYY